ncbi:hypothetical protein JCM5353_005849 [Sporobolomyces roseus]
MLHHQVQQQPMSSPHSHKRRQSHSPSPPSKRRAPPSYIPSLYAPIPTSASALPNFNPSLSTEASYGGTPTSQRSSPGLDWLQRTEDLHLATPLSREMEIEMEMDSTMQDEPHAEVEDPHTLSYSPLPAMPLSQSNSPFSSTSPYPVHPSLPPHEAPPLHHHLAGSPSMTRSNSNTSSNGSVLGQVLHPFPIETRTIAYDSNHNGMEVSMPDHSQSQSQSQVQNGNGNGNGRGWKITMGYRSDCEKCQQRVPGHYTHVVYS